MFACPDHGMNPYVQVQKPHWIFECISMFFFSFQFIFHCWYVMTTSCMRYILYIFVYQKNSYWRIKGIARYMDYNLASIIQLSYFLGLWLNAQNLICFMQPLVKTKHVLIRKDNIEEFRLNVILVYGISWMVGSCQSTSIENDKN